MTNLPTTYVGIRRVFEESDGWRPWSNCPILEQVCPYGKQIAQGPDVDSYIKILPAMIDIFLD